MLFIENVGNLVCPAEFALGANINVVVASVPEGHDKTYKYPGMFAAAESVLLNKFDLRHVFEFDLTSSAAAWRWSIRQCRSSRLLPQRRRAWMPGCAGWLSNGHWRSGDASDECDEVAM